jgi:hypothetical protein
MKKLKRLLQISVTVALLMAMPPLFALPGNDIDNLYYTSNEGGELVGEREILCDGTHYNWGVTTNYRSTTTFSCQGGTEPFTTCYWFNGGWWQEIPCWGH